MYKTKLQKILIITIILCIIFNGFTKVETSFADATTTVGVRTDYLEDLVYITPGTGNSTKFYMSTDKMKTWDIVETSGVVDISAILTTKETIVYFKGNKDGKPYVLTIPAEDSNLKVTYRIASGEGKIELSSLPVEYRKGVNGVWKTASISIPTSIYELKGAALFFRVPATVGKRAGKTITLKIAKRPAAPSVKLDGSKLKISGIKVGETQYRVGEATAWTPTTLLNTSMKTMDLYTLLGAGTTVNTPIPAGIIEFRTLGTDKKLTSAIKVLEVALQPTVPDLVSVTGTALSIRDTDLKRAYEYTKVEKNASLNMLTAKWTTVTSKNTVKIPKVAVGDKILVRLKSITDPKTKQIIPASTYKEFTITNIST
ncbi:MAG: hypothetical protein ACYDEX_01115 [Mobilitalea sp.]